MSAWRDHIVEAGARLDRRLMLRLSAAGLAAELAIPLTTVTPGVPVVPTAVVILLFLGCFPIHFRTVAVLITRTGGRIRPDALRDLVDPVPVAARVGFLAFFVAAWVICGLVRTPRRPADGEPWSLLPQRSRLAPAGHPPGLPACSDRAEADLHPHTERLLRAGSPRELAAALQRRASSRIGRLTAVAKLSDIPLAPMWRVKLLAGAADGGHRGDVLDYESHRRAAGDVGRLRWPRPAVCQRLQRGRDHRKCQGRAAERRALLHVVRA